MSRLVPGLWFCLDMCNLMDYDAFPEIQNAIRKPVLEENCGCGLIVK